MTDKIGIGTQLNKWLSKGTVMGPLCDSIISTKNVTINRLFGVPKPNGDTRPILDLSDKTDTGFSVNDCLFERVCTVEYAQTREVVEIVQALGKNAWLWAKDLEDGYYNVSIFESDIYNLGFSFENEKYVFMRLPMGLSSSPHIFTEFMHFPLWAIKNDKPELYYINIPSNNFNPNNFRNDSDIKYDPYTDTYRIAVIFYYLDDILGGHIDEKEAKEQYKHSEEILIKLNLKTKTVKGKPPKQIQKWLGKMYDTINQWIKLPTEKVEKYIKSMRELINKKTVTQRELLSHIGRTRHMGSIYRPLSAFARNLEVWAYSVVGLYTHINIKNALREDLKLCVWAMLEANKYGVSFEFFLKPMDNPDITLYTDASLLIGIGGISDKGHWFKNMWTDITLHNMEYRDIIWKELCAVFVFVHALRHHLKQKVVHIYTDNEPVKFMLISMRSKLYRPDLQILINKICKYSIKYQFHLWIEHIPGKNNIIPDALSRNFVNPFKSDNHTIYNKQINTTDSLQYASNLCKDIKINEKHLKFEDDDFYCLI